MKETHKQGVRHIPLLTHRLPPSLSLPPTCAHIHTHSHNSEHCLLALSVSIHKNGNGVQRSQTGQLCLWLVVKEGEREKEETYVSMLGLDLHLQ